MTETEFEEMIAGAINSSAQKDANIAENTERFRAAMQGLTFGGADEAEAFFSSMFSDKSYDEELSDVRGKLHDYQEGSPMEALAYEIGGAAVPTIIASIFTGGAAAAAQGARMFPALAKIAQFANTTKIDKVAKVAGDVIAKGAKKFGGKTGEAIAKGVLPAMGQGAKIGAVEGAAYGFGTGEGDVADRFARAGGGAITGAVTGLAGGAGGEGLKAGASVIADVARRTFGKGGAKAVETELARLVRETGKTAEEIIDDVASGRIMAENKTLQATIKAYANQGGVQGARLKTELPARAAQKQDEVIAQTHGGMTNIQNPNLERGMSEIIAGERALETVARKPYQTAPATGEVLYALRDTAKRMPEAIKIAAQGVQLRTGVKDLYKIDKNGDVILSPNITQAQAESIMSSAGQVAQSLAEKTATKRNAADAFGVQGDLRKVIDANVEGMSEIRAKSASTFAKEEAFEAGKKLKSKSPDEAAIYIDDLMAKNPEALDALRSGVLASFKKQISQSGGKTSFIKNLNRDDSKERQLLLALFPEDSIDDLLHKVDVAKGAREAADFVTGQSATQGTQAAAARIGEGMMDDLGGLMGPSAPMAAARIAGRVIKGMGLQVSDAEKKKVVDILLSTDPKAVSAALNDETAFATLINKMRDAVNVTIGATAQGSARVGGAFGANTTGGLLESIRE